MMAYDNTETTETRVTRLNEALRGADAQEVLRVAFQEEWPHEIAYVSSFGAESVAMLALIAEVEPAAPVIFLDTGMHFPQTLEYKATLTEILGLTGVQEHEPDENERLKEDPKNTLWKSDPDACCDLRKVRPLEPALEGFSAWITGRKRFHGGARMQLPVFEASGERVKVNPMASWTQEDVKAFLDARDLPPHPLVSQGYPSIGCWPCTKPAEDPNDVRSGRWAGRDKSECGLHVEKSDRPRIFWGDNI
ncbi:MAG: phosphoadenylyl-sulfate reductase [Pseudomonadota bacterium]